MKATLEQVTSEALTLSPDERCRLTRALIQSLEGEPEEDPAIVEDSWQAEISRRVEEIKSGKVPGIPAEEVFAQLRAKHG
jgi:putative addiction module component (TIGR02574 family)